MKTREKYMQNHCITQKGRFSVLLVKLPSLVIIFDDYYGNAVTVNSKGYTEETTNVFEP